jgi:hypothetical protein
VYNRIHKENLDVSGKALNEILILAKDLIKGANFFKYGRRGKPHQRIVWISEKEDTLFWSDPSKKNKNPRFMPFSEITDVLTGHNSTKVLMKNKVPQEFDNVVFSIISNRRTLDLRAPDADTRFRWEKYFKLHLVERKKGLNKMRTSKRGQEKERLSEIWRIDILPHWENHWDYRSSKPKGFDSITGGRNSASSKPNSSEKKGIMSFLFKSNNKKTSPAKDTASKHLVLDDREDSDTELKLICKNKSLLLVTLWKKGIPDWLRKILWTISMGNQLEVTQSLYEILRIQARNFKTNPTVDFSDISKSLRKMNAEVNSERLAYLLKGFEEKSEEKKISIANVLEAFIFYRPDVGFVKVSFSEEVNFVGYELSCGSVAALLQRV